MKTWPIRFYWHGPPNRCKHGQRQIFHWWQFDWAWIDMSKANRITEVAFRRLWIYSFWGAFFFDIVLYRRKP